MPKLGNSGGAGGDIPFTVTPDSTEISYLGQVLTFQIEHPGAGEDLAGVVVREVGGAPLDLASGDANHNGIYDVGETWVYNATHVVTAADLALGPRFDLNFSGTGTLPDGQVDTVSGLSTVYVTGPLRVVNLVSGDGGLSWYVKGTDLDDEVDDLSALTGIPADQIIIGTPSFLPGQELRLLFVLENSGVSDLTDVHLTDQRYGLDLQLGTLAVGAVYKTELTATAVYGAPVTDVLSATGVDNGVTLQDNHLGEYIAFTDETFQQGPVAHDLAYWRTHPEAWAPFLVTVHDQQGVWIGDVDPATGPVLENSLFIPLEAVEQLLRATGSGDLREVVAAQAIAAQFNLNSGVQVPGGEIEGFQGDLLSEAVAYLYGDGFSQFYSYTGEDIAGRDGFLSAGPNNTFEYNTKNHKFTSPRTEKDSTSATTPYLYESEHYGEFHATGKGLLSALKLFNSNRLVTDPLGQTVGWNPSGEAGGPVTGVRLDGAYDFWAVLHEVTTGHGLFEGIL